MRAAATLTEEKESTVEVLHVDDEPGFADMSSEYLERENPRFEVFTATSVEEALDVLEDGDVDGNEEAEPSVDCVVSDYDMPGMDGVKFLKQVRDSYPDLPFILFTGKGSEEIASAAISAGVTDYLRKESGTDHYTVLANRIENAVGARRNERELHETSKQLCAVLDTVSAAVFMKDPDGKYLLMNENCAEVLDVEDEEELIGLTDYDVFPDDVADRLRKDDARVFEKGEAIEVEEEIPTKDGTRTFLTLKSPVFDEGGEPYAVCGVSTDITERRESEKEIRRLSEEYSTVFDNVQDPMFLVSVEGDGEEFVFRRFNPAYEEKVGISEEEARGKTPRELFGDEDGAGLKENYCRCVEEGETLSYEETLETPVGTRTYHTKISPVCVDGKVTRIVGSARDITERKEREKELERYEAFIENSSDVILHIDEDGTLLYLSPSNERIFGRDPSKRTGENALEYVHPEDRERVTEKISSLLNDPGNNMEKTELRGKNEEGEYVWVEAAGVDQSDTELGGIIVSLRDISERKERENELVEQKQTLETVLSNVPVVLFTLDEEGVITRSQGKALEEIGLESGEVAGESVFEMYEDEPEIIDHVERALDGEAVRAKVENSGTVFESWFEPLTNDEGSVTGVVGLSYDITEREEREKELEHYEALVENTTDLITLVDEEGTVLYQSPSVEHVLGYDPEDAVDNSVFELLHPEDRGRVEEEFSELLEDPEAEMEASEYRYLCADGSYVWFEGSVTDRRDTELGGFLIVARDITGRKEREEETRRLKERLNLAIEGAELAVWDWNVAEDEVTYNDRWAEILGMSPEDADYDVEFREDHAHPDDIPEVNEKLEEHVAGETERFGAEYRMRTADGDWKWIRTAGQAVEWDEDGRAERIVGVHMDIDERKEREKELERYESFIKNSSDVVTHVDEDGTILYQSPSVERVFGYKQDETVGDNAFDYVHPDDEDEMVEEFYDVLNDPERALGEVEYRTKNADGDYVWVEAVGADHTETEAGGFVVNLRDITERKEREKELERYEAFIENSSDVVTHVDEDGTVLYQSPSVENVFGYGQDETVGDYVFDYAHTDDREDIMEEFYAITEDPERDYGELEYRVRDANGDYVWVEATGSDQPSAELDGFVVNQRDITERKKYEEELERSQELLRNTEEISDTGGWEIDTETEAVSWTSGMYDIFGVPEDYEPTLEDAIEAYHPDDREMVRRAIELCREEGEPFDEELRLITAEDEQLWLRVRGEPVRENGEVKTILGSVRDITDQKERERELLRNNMAVRGLYETTADPDLSFDDKVEMILESCRSRLDLGYAYLTEIDEERGTQTVTHARGTHEALQPGESCPLRKAYCRETIESDGLLAVREAADDERVSEEAYDEFGLGSYIGANLSVEGELHGTLCFADTEPREEPFTEFERTLVELMAKWVSYELERKKSNERLRRQKERLDEFASVVSHDLRSPMTVLSGNLELAEETGDSGYFESCRSAIDRMERIMDDLLSLARDVDRTKEVESVDLAEVVEESWRGEYRKDAELRVETEGRILADEGKLRLMVDNLLRNSVEHGGEGVTITVKDLPDGTGFRVEDDGPGIQEEEREHVLEPGYSTRDGGTGLGMYIVTQVAEAHGWDVKVGESEEGGAAFDVTGVETAD